LAKSLGGNVEGKPAAAYAVDIQKPDQWGGAWEIKAIAEKEGVEVCVIGLHATEVNLNLCYNAGASRRICLLYSGQHYDLVVPGCGTDLTFPAGGPPPVIDPQVVLDKLILWHSKRRHEETALAEFVESILPYVSTVNFSVETGLLWHGLLEAYSEQREQRQKSEKKKRHGE
jgi:hypothetical protein